MSDMSEIIEANTIISAARRDAAVIAKPVVIEWLDNGGPAPTLQELVDVLALELRLL